MNFFSRMLGLFLLLMCSSFSLPELVFAHGTGHRVLKDAQTRTLEFYYSDHTPMTYAQVLVFSPLNREIEHQNGRTDKNGVFVFRPDTQGRWLVKVSDGMGHAEEATVEVSLDPESVEPASGRDLLTRDHRDSSIPKVYKAIFGLSLIMNGFLAVYFLKRRSGVADSEKK